MSLDQEIYQQRRAKLGELQALGAAAYPHHYAATHRLAEIAAEYSGWDAERLERDRIHVKVTGRIMTLRGHGKAGFAHLQQAGERLQIYVRQDALGETGFAVWKLVDLGDWLGVEGYLFRTRTGELTVHAEKIELLAKACRPWPEKWHGLQDIERRYRQRYLDLTVNLESRAIFLRRDRLMRFLREAFQQRGYLEVETPMMQPMAGGAAARPFVTHHHALDIPLYLRIAPELYLKRLVAGGLERVFEINRNFRNEGISTRHNPEFTMLEFYEAFSDYRALMGWSEQLLAGAARAVTGGEQVTFHGQTLDFSQCQRLSLREGVPRFWPAAAGPKPGLEFWADRGQLEAAVAAYNRYAATAGAGAPIPSPSGADAGELVMALFENLAEEHLVQPTIVYDFPLSVSPLAKSKPDEADWVERFEIYAGGMEIANGYSELNDPEEQERRFRQQAGADAAIDSDYVRALEYGMPPTAGEGIGIDRLVMLLTDAASIRDVILFPLQRPETAAEPESLGG